MSEPSPIARLTAVTLGVRDLPASVRFYQALGFARRFRASGDEIAFFDAGGVVLALYGWDQLAQDAAAPTPDPGKREGKASTAFRGTTLAWNCASRTGVDAAFVRALAAGGTLLKAAQQTSWGGYSGYFADPDRHPWEIVHAPGFSFSTEGRLLLPD